MFEFRIFLLITLISVPFISYAAEEYMKRGATVEDYAAALARIKRGVVTRSQIEPVVPPPSETKHTAGAATKAAVTQVATPAKPTAPTPRAPAARPGSEVYTPSQPDHDTSDGLSIYFGFNRADLTPEAATALRRLGQALATDEFREMSWIIEGHTDASGTESYNQSLSEQRAEAARRYLIDCCGIPANKLFAVGKGKSEPYSRDNPYASVNRRVRIRPFDG